MRSTPLRWAFAFLLILIFGGCSQARPGAPLLAPGAVRGLPRSPHARVVEIVMENEESANVLGNRTAPFLNSLVRRYALAADYYGISHPSLPNYLALIGGSTFGINSDCSDCSVNATNLVDQLEAAGISWTAYMEGLPHACAKDRQVGGYVKRHDPFMYFTDIAGSSERCAHVVPYTRLGHALRSGTLPGFTWITPNLCDDGHDCSLADADRFLAGIVPAILHALPAHAVLIITWDEGSSDAGCCAPRAAGGRVVSIFAGPGARAGARSTVPYDHYSLLRTIEDLLGLSHLRAAAHATTASMSALLRSGSPVR